MEVASFHREAKKTNQMKNSALSCQESKMKIAILFVSCISNYFIVLSKTPLDYQLLSYEYPFHHFCGKDLSGASNLFLFLFGVGGFRQVLQN